MAYGDLYQPGTATLDDVDLDIVHIDGALLTSNVVSDDTFELAGRRVTIAEVVDNETLRLAYDWPDSPFEDAAYVIKMDAATRNPPVALARSIRDRNEILRIFYKASPNFVVVEYGVNTPPEDYAVGDTLVIGSSPTGVFASHVNALATATEEGGWTIQPPSYGWLIISQDDPLGSHVARIWTGSAWITNAGLGATVNYEGVWSGAADYRAGNVVLHNAKLWIADGDTTNEEPGVAGPWDEYPTPSEHGGVAITLQFNTNTADSDPGSGKVKLNHATPGSATILRISKFDLWGGDWSTFIAGINTSTTSTQKGKIRLKKLGDPKAFVATVMSATAVGDYFNLTISSPSQVNGNFANNDVAVFFFQERGDVGATGGTGATGARGLMGGPNAIRYTFSDTTTDSDPGNGVLRLDTATQNVATTIRADLLSAAGADVTALLGSIATASTSDVKVNGRLVLESDPEGKWLSLDMTAVATPTGYRNIAITITGQSDPNPLVPGQSVVLAWSAKGDKGDQGDVGAVGPVGPIGPSYEPDQFVDTYADKAEFDDEAAGFGVVVIADENEDGATSLYIKRTGETADWRSPIPWGGAGSGSGGGGLLKCRTVAVVDVDIASGLEHGDSLNGVTLAADDVVLLIDQDDEEENGVYVVSSSGAASRHPDFATYDAIAGASFAVMEGSDGAGTIFHCTSAPGGVLDTDPLLFDRVISANALGVVLSDYADIEAGTWTPELRFSTIGNLSVSYSIRSGVYIRFGDLVWASFMVTTSSFTHSTANGSFRVAGLPFMSENVTNQRAFAAGHWAGINKSGYTDFSAQVIENTNYVQPVLSGPGAAFIGSIAPADVPSGGTVIIRATLIYKRAP